MMPFIFLAEVAGSAAAAVDSDSWWKTAALAGGGMLLMRLLSWVSTWIDGKGKEWMHERFTKLQEKINSNEVMAQIQADDVVIRIIEESIPEVILELSETAQNDLKDGKFDAVDWAGIGTRIWQRVRPHIEGGKSDYLKNSSFTDGAKVAAWVAQKFFAKKQAQAKGLVK